MLEVESQHILAHRYEAHLCPAFMASMGREAAATGQAVCEYSQRRECEQREDEHSHDEIADTG